MPVKQYTIQQLLHPIKTFGVSFTPDERSILYISNESGVLNVFAVPVNGGPSRQLTFSTEHLRYAGIGRNDRRLYYTKDCGSQENTHLFVVDAAGRERLLTPGEQVQVRFMGWNPRYTAFYCATNERDPKHFDLYRIHSPDYDRELIYKDSSGLHFCTLSKNEKYAAFIRIRNRAASDIFLYDLQTKELREVAGHTAEAYVQPCCFSIDSSRLYFLSDEGAEISYLCALDLATGKTATIMQPSNNIKMMSLSPQGTYRVLLVDSDARNKLIVERNDSSGPVNIPELDEYSVTSIAFSESEKFMACLAERDRSPTTLFVFEFASGHLRKLAGGLKDDIDPTQLVESTHVSFDARDGMTIRGLLWKPKCASRDNRVPALVWVHGGPGGQTRRSYSARIQFFVNHGYAVFGVNHRGSSGYGKTFYRADEGKQGREPLWDCVDAKKYLESLDYIEPERIGIIGGSFGGYMALAALAFEPYEFAVGVDICGVSNWLRAFEVFPPYWATIQRNIMAQKVADPVVDRDKLRAMSPLFYAEQIVRPLMVIQGANDPRVKRCEADDIVTAVRKHGGTVEYLLFEDEAHALRKGVNAVKAYNTILDFLERYLRGSSSCSRSDHVEHASAHIDPSCADLNLLYSATRS
jgi:dipeptidyl aminopeptidase/acylaminoacyl peptidase